MQESEKQRSSYDEDIFFFFLRRINIHQRKIQKRKSSMLIVNAPS